MGTSTSVASTRPLAVGGGQQLLGHDPLERDRELHAHLLLLGGGNTSMMRSTVCARVLRVQRGEHEVAGLGRGQRGRDRLEVAHLADEDHVGVLAQRGLQRRREVWASAPISRWLTMHFLCWCRYSIGSSIVMMCSARAR